MPGKRDLSITGILEGEGKGSELPSPNSHKEKEEDWNSNGKTRREHLLHTLKYEEKTTVAPYSALRRGD